MQDYERKVMGNTKKEGIEKSELSQSIDSLQSPHEFVYPHKYSKTECSMISWLSIPKNMQKYS